jgi:hypothetical protein
MARVRSWAAVLVVLGPAAALAVTTEDFKIVNARDVVDVCTVPESDPYYTAAANFCHGYAVATWDVYQALMARPGAKPFVCMPNPRPARSAVVAQFATWLNAHPQYDNEHPTNAIFKFLAEKWPCRKS